MNHRIVGVVGVVGMVAAGIGLNGCTGAAGGGQTDPLAAFQLGMGEAFDARIANVSRSINDVNSCLGVAAHTDQQTLDELKAIYRRIQSAGEDFEMFVERAERELTQLDAEVVCQMVPVITADANRATGCFDPDHEVTRVLTDSENFEGLRVVYLANPMLALDFAEFTTASAEARQLVADQICTVELGQDQEFDDLVARFVASANRRAMCRNETPAATNQNAIPVLKSSYYSFAVENQTLIEFAREFVPNYEENTDTDPGFCG